MNPGGAPYGTLLPLRCSVGLEFSGATKFGFGAFTGMLPIPTGGGGKEEFTGLIPPGAGGLVAFVGIGAWPCACACGNGGGA